MSDTAGEDEMRDAQSAKSLHYAERKMLNSNSGLSPYALDALNEFFAERNAHTEELLQLQTAAEQVQTQGRLPSHLSMDAFAEDWTKSQFWYSDQTAKVIARQLLDGATADTTIAVVSTPSVFIALKNLLNDHDTDVPRPKLVLLEHDNRFAVFQEFVMYDYTQPLKLPGHLRGSVDRFILDPPYLNEDCQTKCALTIRWLARAGRPASTDEQVSSSRLIICTGERMQGLVTKLYQKSNLKSTDFEVVHARGLSNEFLCYASFECEHWKWATLG